MLTVDGLCAGYGASQVLFDLTLQVGAGEVVALMGRNGMGKTTTVRALMGLLPATKGSIRLSGRELRGLPPHEIARLGFGLVPEGRQVFPNLSVHENLVATARRAPAGMVGWSLARVFGLFPRLAERRSTLAGRLSGGEQQMLAVGRALLTNPRLLILDEATEGLAPAVRGEIWACLGQLKRAGLAILVIDKHVGPLLALADRQVILEKGCCVWQGCASEFRSTPGLKERFLGL